MLEVSLVSIVKVQAKYIARCCGQMDRYMHTHIHRYIYTHRYTYT